MRKGKEQHWQREPGRLITDKVAVYSFTGTMLTAQCSLKDARAQVEKGNAFCVSDSSIAHFEPETIKAG
jgi:hypothetical protein